MTEKITFHTEIRRAGIPPGQWRKIQAAMEKISMLTIPFTGLPDTPGQILLKTSDTSNLAYLVGREAIEVRRLWKKSEYATPPLLRELTLDPLGDLFVRCFMLLVISYAPANCEVRVVTKGCRDGWTEAMKLVEKYVSMPPDLAELFENKVLFTLDGSHIPISGDAPLVGLAEQLLNPGSIPGSPKASASAPVLIPFPARSWFF